jgi:tetratricopeptide (TPR) repeat protein
MDRRRVLQGMGAGTLLAAGSQAFAPNAFAQGGYGLGRWLRFDSANFVYFSAAGETKGREEVAALEGFHALLSRLMPRSQRSPLRLEVYNTTTLNELRAALPGAEESIYGFYQSRIEHIRAVTSTRKTMERQRDVPRHARALDARTVLFHEYAHHHMRANNRLAYPAWYTEGFAEFLSTAEFNDKGADVGKVTVNRATWIIHGDWLAIEPFLTKHPAQLKDGEEVAQFYAQAWMAAHYLFSTPERAKGFDRYTTALLQGGDLLGAFEPAFGITPAQFDKELKDYKKQPIRFWTIGDAKPDASSIKVQPLGRSVDELLLPMSYLRMLPQREEAAPSIAKVRDEVKKYPNDLYAMQCKALIEVWYGDLAEARKQIDALLALDDKNADVHHLSGLCDLRNGRKLDDKDLLQKAQNAFGRAHQLDDTRPQTMYRYVESGLALSGMDEHLLDVLVGAYLLAPQVDPIALTAAQALIEHERYAEAVAVLRPLTAELHGDDMAHVARELTRVAQAEESAMFSFFGAAIIDGE